jgi:hypothetical protein
VEARHGFVPLSGEMGASRVRRRYRLIKGGHPFLVLIHYSRGQSTRQYLVSLHFLSWHQRTLFLPLQRD